MNNHHPRPSILRTVVGMVCTWSVLGAMVGAVDGLGGGVEPQVPRGDEAERDDDRLVVREHERRQAIARPDPVAAADASLPLDRDVERLERGDVAPDRAAVDPELVGDLPPRRERLRLQEFEELEQP